MGEITNRYDVVDRLPEGALSVALYAKKVMKKHRSYVQVLYDRHRKGFTKQETGKKYYGKDPGYTIVVFQGKLYVIDNSLINDQY